MRRLLLHEARVHAIPGRDLRDLGDAILLHDPAEREPFWNRLEGLRWPDDPAAFDRRLTEVLVLFASIGRTPHIWASPLHDSPADLVARLEANGFRDMGTGNLMAPGRSASRPSRRPPAPIPDGVSIERLAGVTGPTAEAASSAIVDVLLDAFDVDAGAPAGDRGRDRRLARPSVVHPLPRPRRRRARRGRPAGDVRGRYLPVVDRDGRLGARSRPGQPRHAARRGRWTRRRRQRLVYLGVFADNRDAIGVYERSGFEQLGTSCPDLLLW